MFCVEQLYLRLLRPQQQPQQKHDKIWDKMEVTIRAATHGFHCSLISLLFSWLTWCALLWLSGKDGTAADVSSAQVTPLSHSTLQPSLKDLRVRVLGSLVEVTAGHEVSAPLTTQQCFPPVWTASQEEQTDRLISASCWCPPPPGQAGSAIQLPTRPSHHPTEVYAGLQIAIVQNSKYPPLFVSFMFMLNYLSGASSLVSYNGDDVPAQPQEVDSRPSSTGTLKFVNHSDSHNNM